MKKKINWKKHLNWLVESAIMISLAIVLELTAKMFIPEMPFGGQVTLASMFPVVLVGWKYGIGKGLVTGFVYSIAEMLLGVKTISALMMPSSEDYLGSLANVVLMFLFDYIIAFAVLGLGAIYKKAIKNNSVSLGLGAMTVVFLRYVSHIVSGYILYGAWAEWFFTQEGFYSWGQTIMNTYTGNALSLVYSIIYNGFYMIPEIIITTIVATIIGKIPQITKTKA
jgi:thiamine transporter